MSRDEPAPVRELAVLEGGRWGGRWYWRADLEASQRAAERMAHPVTVAGPGELRGYAPTDRWAEHPGDEHEPGRVWTWRPERVEHRDLDRDAEYRGAEEPPAPGIGPIPGPRRPADDLEQQGEGAQAGRVLVCGSRQWSDVGTIRGELAAAWSELATAAGAPVLVHGACPRGADRIADMLWRRWGGAVETYPADWQRHGRGAGYRRNAEMVATRPDRVLGFVLDASPGSTHTLALATEAGLDVRTHHATSGHRAGQGAEGRGQR